MCWQQPHPSVRVLCLSFQAFVILYVLSLSPPVLCLLVAKCSPGPSDHLCAIPSAYRSGTWIFAHGDSTTLLLKKTSFQWTTVTQEASSESSWCGLHLHSCPVLPRFNTAFCSEVKLLKPNSWSYFITTKAVCSMSVHFVSSVKAFRDT